MACFLNKQTKGKFPIFVQNQGLAPSKQKSQCDNYVKSLFFCLGGLVLLLHDHQTLLQGPFCPKKKQRGNFKF